MFDSSIASERPDWRSPRAWLAARLSIEFILDVATISRGGGDLIDPLLLTAVLDANQAPIRHDPQLARLYGDAQSALPDELRRPISVNALAKSLRLPLESVRRRVSAWLDAGICVRTAAGVYVRQAFVTSPTYLAIQAARIERLVGFRRDLTAAGAIVRPELAPGALSTLTRAADRLLAEYMLRTCERLIDLTDSPTDSFFLLGLAAQNAAGFSGALAAPVAGDLASAAQPCSVGALAARLDVPQSTVRRRLAALAERGLAEHGARGWIVSTPPELQAQAAQLAAESFKNLRRLLHRLDALVQR